MRMNLEWVMEEVGYFVKGERLPAERRLRRLARRYMKRMGYDLEGLQAGHPIDDVIGAYFRRSGDVGSAYYFMEENVNREFGRLLARELSRLDVQPGERFTIIFDSNSPS
jgi:hypothetical protein